MKVKELIKELQKFDWDMEVNIYDREDNMHCDSFEFKVEVEWFSHYKDGSLLGSKIFPTQEKAEEAAKEHERLNPTYRNVLTIYADY
jgi:hypothetical protein